MTKEQEISARIELKLELSKKEKENDTLKRKLVTANARNAFNEKEIKMLRELIQKQHLSQPIKMLVCEQCGKELQQ